jgi:preprotein translocase subunit SecF
MEIIKPGRQFDFMSKRWLFVGLSLLLLLGSIFTFIHPGPRLGTDFRGGTEVEIAFKKAVDAGHVRATVQKLGFEAPDVVSVTDLQNPNHYLIRVQEVSALSEAEKHQLTEKLCLIPEGGAAKDGACPARLNASEVKFSPGGDKISVRYDQPITAEDLPVIAKEIDGVPGVSLRAGHGNVVLANEREHKVELYLKSKGDQLLDGLRASLGADTVPDQALRVEWIGPKAGAQLRDAAIKSVAIAILFIMAYVAFRFDLRFAPGGIIALAHDVGIALGAMILAHKEITLSTVAAMLTIVGYSMNDTVIVYDRIRENLTKHRSMSFAQIINLSVSEMLGRTIITSGVTALSMICFLFWGTGVIKDFAFALLIGILVGTYSSIYIAAPITEWIDRHFFGSSVSKRKHVTRTRTTKRADAVV